MLIELSQRMRTTLSCHPFLRGCCRSFLIFLTFLLVLSLLSLPVKAEENEQDEEERRQILQKDDSEELPLPSSVSLTDFSVQWKEEEKEALFTIALSVQKAQLLEVTLLLPSLTRGEIPLCGDTVSGFEAEGLGDAEHWEFEVKEENARFAVFTLFTGESPGVLPQKTPETLLLYVHAKIDDAWNAYCIAHPEEEAAFVQEGTVTVRSDEGEVTASAKTAMTSLRRAQKAGSSDLFVKKIWKDEGLERKRPDTITFDLYRREEDGSLTLMPEEYTKTAEVTSDEQYVQWDHLPAGSFVIKERPVPGYSTEEQIEEYKDSELHVFVNTIENTTRLHLSKQYTNSDGIPVRKDTDVSFLLETYEQRLNETEFRKIKEETITLHTDNGNIEWDSEPLPLSSSSGEYYYKLKECGTDRYEVFYSLNNELFDERQWEEETTGLMRFGTLTVTNREKVSSYRLPSTGGSGKGKGAEEYRRLLLTGFLILLVQKTVRIGKGQR